MPTLCPAVEKLWLRGLALLDSRLFCGYVAPRVDRLRSCLQLRMEQLEVEGSDCGRGHEEGRVKPAHLELFSTSKLVKKTKDKKRVGQITSRRAAPAWSMNREKERSFLASRRGIRSLRESRLINGRSEPSFPPDQTFPSVNGGGKRNNKAWMRGRRECFMGCYQHEVRPRSRGAVAHRSTWTWRSDAVRPCRQWLVAWTRTNRIEFAPSRGLEGAGDRIEAEWGQWLRKWPRGCRPL
jgi:hypothetical protein